MLVRQNIVVEEEFVKLLEETKKTRFMVCRTGPVIKKGQTMVKEGDKISSFMVSQLPHRLTSPRLLAILLFYLSTTTTTPPLPPSFPFFSSRLLSRWRGVLKSYG